MDNKEETKKRYTRDENIVSEDKLGNYIKKNEDKKDDNKIDNYEEKLSNAKKNTIIITMLVLIILTLVLRQLTGIGTSHDTITVKKPNTIKISVDYNMVDSVNGQNIKIEVEPKGSDTRNLKWYIEDEDILEIKNNMVFGKDKGKTKIILANNIIKSNSLEIESVKFIDAIEVENSVDSIPIKSEYTYNVKQIPEDAANLGITIESSNPSVISVREDKPLTIYGEKKGESNIIFKDVFGNVLKEELVKVEWERITDIIPDAKNYIIGRGQKNIISAELKPQNATFRDLKYFSTNPSIASIDENNIITGNSIGNCEIVISSNDGKIKASTKVSVVDEPVYGEKKYVSGAYNVFSGPSDMYDNIATTNTWEEVEILSEKEGYTKIRDMRGNPGFVKNDTGIFFDKLPIMIRGLEYIAADNYGYKTAGELLSAYMAIKYVGHNDIQIEDIIAAMETGEKVHIVKEGEEEKRKGANPFKLYVGDIYESKYNGKYGVYAKPLVDAINRVKKNTAEDISGKTEEEILGYIDNNIPVIIWSNSEKGKIIEDGITWETEEGEEITEKKNFDVLVLIGYNKNYVIVDDPIRGSNIILNRKEFFENNNRIYNQALIINSNNKK